MLGDDRPFELEWVSVYTFQCRRMERFRHGRVIFAGDAAHQVSPFGARGANSGIQDTDNLVWKLALVLAGQAPEALLDTYDAERTFAADENILNSTRSTDFITPKTPVDRVFRDATLELAHRHPFARKLVNSGRLSVPATLRDSPLNTADAPTARFTGLMRSGAPAADAPVRSTGGDAWLLDALGGGFDLLLFAPGDNFVAPDADDLAVLARDRIAVRVTIIVPPGRGGLRAPEGCRVLEDVAGLAEKRYDGRPGSVYLLRPDQHVCARWRRFDADAVRGAVRRATCTEATDEVRAAA
jgi:3-(3-hydroxy-phenyl)propionate hydroxylase